MTSRRHVIKSPNVVTCRLLVDVCVCVHVFLFISLVFIGFVLILPNQRNASIHHAFIICFSSIIFEFAFSWQIILRHLIYVSIFFVISSDVITS